MMERARAPFIKTGGRPSGTRDPGRPGQRCIEMHRDGNSNLYKGKTLHSPATTNKMLKMNFFSTVN